MTSDSLGYSVLQSALYAYFGRLFINKAHDTRIAPYARCFVSINMLHFESSIKSMCNSVKFLQTDHFLLGYFLFVLGMMLPTRSA